MIRSSPVLTLALVLALCPSPARAQDKITEGGFPVTWEGWSFSWKVLPRQGVVLTKVTFQGKSVLKYAGVAEVFVPYHPGTPRIQDQEYHPFGANLVPLEPGVDCLPGGDCKAFTADGKPAKTRAVVMLHEEAPSPIYMGRAGKAKAKMLVLWSAYALGDYTYIVQWRFREDGCLMPRVGLTGKLAYFGGDKSNSVQVAPNQRALAHVHNFFFCLDFDVDGAKNSVEEFNYTLADKDAGRAEGVWTPLDKEGGRELKPEAFRSWRVVNGESKNKQGNPRSYEVVPSGTGIFRGRTKEKFTHADMWVTKFKADEVPGTELLADSLAAYANGESVKGEDVVLWYMMSVHHQPKAEDWPDMPLEWCGFTIAPRDFLDGSVVKPGK
jgi:primary-amine oxidase